MIKQTFTQKETGDSLSASEWNEFTGYVNTAVDAINAGAAGVVTVTDETASGGDPTVGVAIASGVQQVGSPKVIELTKKKKGVNTTITSENNINFEPRESVGETKGGNISFKPGDDIEFCSHHRLEDNQDEVSIKVIDGDDNPVKLQLNAAEMTLTTKGKTGNDAAVFDVNVNSAKNTKGYLKVRAQAIDLRCESHGGIALQPKGEDGQGNMNKIKFEHGGGDGLEFGTFNAEKSSLYTDEYRFKKDGVVKLASRTTAVSDKYDNSDETTHYKYVKAADDFYDNIDSNDPTCTWEDIVKAGENTKLLGLHTFSKSIRVFNTIRPRWWYNGHVDDHEGRDKLSTTEFNQSYSAGIQNGTFIVIDLSSYDVEQEFQGEIEIYPDTISKKLTACGVTDATTRNQVYNTLSNAEDGKMIAINSANDTTLLYTVFKAEHNFSLSYGNGDTVSLASVIDTTRSLTESDVCKWSDVQNVMNILQPRIEAAVKSSPSVSGRSGINFTFDLEDIYKIGTIYIDGIQYGGIYTTETYNTLDTQYYADFGVHIPLYDISYGPWFNDGFFTHSEIEDELDEWDEEYDDIVEENGQQNYLDSAGLSAQLQTLPDNAIFALKCEDGDILLGEKFKADIIFNLNEGNTVTETVKLSDISKLVNYMKTNNEGPWATNL